METIQADTAGKWVAENWQIPVPLGDCSVHILLYKQPHPVVQRAFLMDGGTDSGSYKAKNQIKTALVAIDEYVQDSTWTFEAWVVTHWDKDHYDGVKQLLEDEEQIYRNNKLDTFFNHYFRNNRSANHKPPLYCGADMPKPLSSKPESVFSNSNKAFNIQSGEKLIGIDLFTGDKMFNIDDTVYPKIPDPTRDSNQPRFCVVGANDYGLGSAEKTGSGTPTKNQTSIISVLYWPGEGKGKCSYFTGGDGNPLVETSKIAVALKTNTAKNRMGHISYRLPQLPLRMLKLDHHGSTGENLGHAPTQPKNKKEYGGTIKAPPPTPIYSLEPRSYLVTPGSQFGHPTWDVLEYIGRHMKYKRVIGLPMGKLYTTRSPYWMAKDKPTGSQINVGHYSSLLPQVDAFKDELFYDSLREQVSETMHRVAERMLLSKMKEDEARKELMRLLEESGKMKDVPDKEKWKVLYRAIAAKTLPTGNDLPLAIGEFKLARSAMEKHRNDLKKNALKVWKSISKQPIIVDGNPFFLLRFFFHTDGKRSGVKITRNDGQAKTALFEDISDESPVISGPLDVDGEVQDSDKVEDEKVGEFEEQWDYEKWDNEECDDEKWLSEFDFSNPNQDSNSLDFLKTPSYRKSHFGGTEGEANTGTYAFLPAYLENNDSVPGGNVPGPNNPAGFFGQGNQGSVFGGNVPGPNNPAGFFGQENQGSVFGGNVPGTNNLNPAGLFGRGNDGSHPVGNMTDTDMLDLSKLNLWQGNQSETKIKLRLEFEKRLTSGSLFQQLNEYPDRQTVGKNGRLDSLTQIRAMLVHKRQGGTLSEYEQQELEDEIQFQLRWYEKYKKQGKKNKDAVEMLQTFLDVNARADVIEYPTSKNRKLDTDFLN